MGDELDNLMRTARQLVHGEELLGGDYLPGRRNPLPPTTVPANAPQASASAKEPVPTPARRDAAPPPTPAAPARRTAVAKPANIATGPDISQALPDMTPQQKAQALEELAVEARKCLSCCLGSQRLNLVFGEGNPAADLVFVGEAPGADEDATGRPFVGKAGQKLTEMIGAMGLRREDVYICNILKCRPPNNRPPVPDEVQTCWPFLLRQLQILRPKAMVTLGNPATQTLLQTREGITRLRGQWQKLPALAPGLEGIPVMPTFHPSYVIRTYTKEVRGMVWSDLQQVMQLLGLSLPEK